MNEPTSKIPTIILGASGYVAGELFRLFSAHPHLDLVAAVSESQAGSAGAGQVECVREALELALHFLRVLRPRPQELLLRRS